MQQGYYNGSSLNLHFEILFKNSGFFSILQKKQGTGGGGGVEVTCRAVSQKGIMRW